MFSPKFQRFLLVTLFGMAPKIDAKVAVCSSEPRMIERLVEAARAAVPAVNRNRISIGTVGTTGAGYCAILQIAGSLRSGDRNLERLREMVQDQRLVMLRAVGLEPLCTLPKAPGFVGLDETVTGVTLVNGPGPDASYVSCDGSTGAYVFSGLNGPDLASTLVHESVHISRFLRGLPYEHGRWGVRDEIVLSELETDRNSAPNDGGASEDVGTNGPGRGSPADRHRVPAGWYQRAETKRNRRRKSDG